MPLAELQPNVVVVGRDSDIRSFRNPVDAQEQARFVAQGEGANDDIAPGIVEALREAHQCAVEDEDLPAEPAQQQRPLAPLSAEETAALVQDVLDSPQELTQLVTESC